MLKREFVATVYLLHNNRTLLHFHKKLQRWLPPGGHVEENETPDETAKREVKEETGLDIDLIENHGLDIDFNYAKSLPKPYLILLEYIPPYQATPEHQHIDYIFLAEPKSDVNKVFSPFQWLTLEEILALPETELLPDVLQVCTQLLTKSSFVNQ